MMTIKQISVTVGEITQGYVNNEELGVRGYNGKLDIRPPYQREFIYNDKEQQAVINTVLHGYPLKITEIAATLDGTCYVTRQSVHTVAAINRAKKAIRKAFEYSMQGRGSNLVEIVSTCNSGWKMSPEKANKWMEENMFKFYQLGDLKDTGAAK